MARRPALPVFPLLLLAALLAPPAARAVEWRAGDVFVTISTQNRNTSSPSFNLLRVYDPVTLAQRDELDLTPNCNSADIGPDVAGATFSRDQTLLYVTCTVNKILIINANGSSHAVIGSFSTLPCQGPEGIALASDGTFYIGGFGIAGVGRGICQYAPDGTFLQFYASTSSLFIEAVTLLPGDNELVFTTFGSSITSLFVANGTLAPYAPDVAGGGLGGLIPKVGSGGNVVIVADAGSSGCVYEIQRGVSPPIKSSCNDPAVFGAPIGVKYSVDKTKLFTSSLANFGNFADPKFLFRRDAADLAIQNPPNASLPGQGGYSVAVKEVFCGAGRCCNLTSNLPLPAGTVCATTQNPCVASVCDGANATCLAPAAALPNGSVCTFTAPNSSNKCRDRGSSGKVDECPKSKHYGPLTTCAGTCQGGACTLVRGFGAKCCKLATPAPKKKQCFCWKK